MTELNDFNWIETNTLFKDEVILHIPYTKYTNEIKVLWNKKLKWGSIYFHSDLYLTKFMLSLSPFRIKHKTVYQVS